MLSNLVLVFIGGGLGSLVRFGISMAVLQYYRTVFPVATLLSNVFSCIVFGLIIMLGYKMNTEMSMRVFILTGFCGGFSTFSTFSFETVELFKTGNVLYAVLNILISLALCFGVIFFLTRSNS